jgi:hypothetical protein
MAIKIPIIVTADTKKLTGVTKGLDQLGKAATMALAAVAAAGAAIAVLSVREFAKFDGALQKSVSIMGDLSSAMRDDMASAAREVAKTTTFSAEQAAESFFFLASAGLDAEQSIFRTTTSCRICASWYVRYGAGYGSIDRRSIRTWS